MFYENDASMTWRTVKVGAPGVTVSSWNWCQMAWHTGIKDALGVAVCSW